MKGTQALQRPSAGRLEGDVIANDVIDTSSLAHQRDVLVSDTTVHSRDPRRPMESMPASIPRLLMRGTLIGTR